MATGKVKWFNPSQGFGFIRGDNGDCDIFVHRTGFQNGVILDDGDKVKFELVDGRKGPSAQKVEILEKSPSLPPEVY